MLWTITQALLAMPPVDSKPGQGDAHNKQA